jgi:hypothetical protein
LDERSQIAATIDGASSAASIGVVFIGLLEELAVVANFLSSSAFGEVFRAHGAIATLLGTADMHN